MKRRRFLRQGVSTLSLAPQLYVAGHPGNASDGVFRRLKGEVQRQAVQAEFRTNPDNSADLLAEWDVVMG